MADNKIREAVQFLSEGDKALVINYYIGSFYFKLIRFCISELERAGSKNLNGT